MQLKIFLLVVLAIGLKSASSKTVVATFSTTTLTGTITFTQAPTGGNTTIAVALNNVLNGPNKWHVHVFPVSDGCGSTSTGGHYNPFNVNPAMCATNWSSCEVGDLSGKFGKFNNLMVTKTFSDNNLPLYGRWSIVGRSIVIHAADGSRMACATIKETVAMRTVVTTFDSPVAGTITLMQPVADATADTSILVDLWYANKSMAPTTGHKYHVHTSMMSAPGDCSSASTGGHFNPLGATGTCMPSNPSTCEIGDLSGKHGLLNLPSSGSSKQFFTDTMLPLSGANSVTLRSIVIHAANAAAPRIACGDTAKTVTATFDQNGVSGTVKLVQASAADSTAITVSLAGLGNQPNKWHVHTLPVLDSCAASSTGGHYNPLGVDPAACATAAPSAKSTACEVGDLSGKFGTLTTPTVSASFTDTNLPLFGTNSVTGRSIVIHNSDNSRMVCASLAPSFMVKTVRTVFYSGSARGVITLTQAVNDMRGDTQIVARLTSAPGAAASTGHKWHVHQSLVLGQPCLAALGHYNPALVPVTGCNPAQPASTCEVGDLSGKHGTLSLSPTGSPMMWTDTNLPLSGMWSVGARSIVIHAANQGAPRIACADTATVLRAYYWQPRASGMVTMVQATAYDAATISVAVDGLAISSPWAIHAFPITDSCTMPSIGSQYMDLTAAHGALVGPQAQATYTDMTVKLSGPGSVRGRTLVISDGGAMRCASLKPLAPMKTVKATFAGTLRGVVALSQVAADSGGDTDVQENLWYADAATAATVQHKYHVHTSPIVNGDCMSAGGHYNPFGVNVALCATATDKTAACEVGDLSGKHGTLPLPSTGLSQRYYSDGNLPLSGAFSVGARSIVVHAANLGGPRIACATLGKQVLVKYNQNGVTGNITLLQASAADPTSISLSLEGLGNQPNKWHVHSLPVIDSCGPTSTGGHYNPLGVDPAACATAAAADKSTACEIGDLSGKFGTLTTPTVSASFTDTNLPLFGNSSVIGRSIVIHNSDGSRMVCADIGQAATAIASASRKMVTMFSNRLVGTITMTQAAWDPTADTTVLVNLAAAPGTPPPSASSPGHKFHVHQKPISGSCFSAGGHYNPWNVKLDLCASAMTGDSKDMMCEIGDLSAKHGLLKLPSTGASKWVFTDSNLPLSGAYSVADRSIVVHDDTRYSKDQGCASIGMNAVATFATPSGAFGTIAFQQSDSKSPTAITVGLSGLKAATAYKWHVHTLPVSNGCGPTSTAGHFNPFGVTGTCSAAQPVTTCEVGDLSGKHGTLAGPMVSANFSDPNLPLSGINSIVGRSIVLHDPTGARVACATIGYPRKVTTSVATFSGSPLTGTITFRQAQGDPLAQTSVEVDLGYTATGTAPTTGHKWHVHANKVAASGDCATAGGHFNPQGVPLGMCSPSLSPADKKFYCEVGDLSGKGGLLSLPSAGAGALFQTDPNLPLTGAQSVADLSIVIHAANSGAPRIACANLVTTQPTATPSLPAPSILPLNSVRFVMRLDGFTQASFEANKDKFLAAVAAAGNIPLSSIKIDAVVAVAANTRRRRRQLLQSAAAVIVRFTVATSSGQAATDLRALMITAVRTGTFTSALKTSGLYGIDASMTVDPTLTVATNPLTTGMLTPGAIAGIVVGGIAGCAFLALVGFLVFRSVAKDAQPKRRPSNAEQL